MWNACVLWTADKIGMRHDTSIDWYLFRLQSYELHTYEEVDSQELKENIRLKVSIN